MSRKGSRSLDATGQPRVYEPADPSLRAYDHGVGTLSVAGELVGHLASRVGEMRFPSRQPWAWFVIVWLDGRREPPFEDYGPGWYTVRELDAGYFEHTGPSTGIERRVLGLRFGSTRRGETRSYEYTRLPPDLAALRWDELGLDDDDF